MPIPKTDQWKQDTSVFLKPRNAALQALDKTIEHYNTDMNPDNGLDNLWKVKNAFEYWKTATGPAWEHSDRNARHAMTALAAALNTRELTYGYYRDETMDKKQRAGWEFWKENRTKTIRSLFYANDQPRPVVFKPFDMMAQLKQNLRDVRARGQKFLTKMPVKGMGPNPNGNGMMAAPTKDIAFWKGHFKEGWMGFVEKCFDIDNVTSLPFTLNNIIMRTVEECVETAAPWLGHVREGLYLVKHWTEVAVDCYHKSTISNCKYAIEVGNPAEAFAGLKRCLDLELEHDTERALAASAAFAIKTGLFFVDGGVVSGPVMSGVETLEKVAHNIYLMGMEYRASQDLKNTLEQGPLDMTLFRDFPLMGCYFLNCSTFSDLVPIECFGTPGWQDFMDKFRKGPINDILQQSVKFINRSQWEIKGMPKMPRKEYARD